MDAPPPLEVVDLPAEVCALTGCCHTVFLIRGHVFTTSVELPELHSLLKIHGQNHVSDGNDSGL